MTLATPTATRPRPSRVPAPPARRAGLAALALVAGLALAGCGDDADDGTARDPGSTTPSASDPASSSGSPTEETTGEPSESADASPSDVATVYFVVDTARGLRLARAPEPSDGEPGTGAVRAMLDGPSDPDHTSTWNPATEVLDVSLGDDGVITVDLSAEARTANVGSPGAEAMVQQLVWTATEALEPEASVRLLVDGEPAGELWGAVVWDEPVARSAPEEVRAPVGIDSPAEGAGVASPVSVSGEASAVEANVPWRVLDERGEEVDSGFTTAEEAMTFAPYSFEVPLESGTYVVEVAEEDLSDGEGGEPYVESRTVTVE